MICHNYALIPMIILMICQNHKPPFDALIKIINYYHNHNDNKHEHLGFNGTSTKPTIIIRNKSNVAVFDSCKSLE